MMTVSRVGRSVGSRGRRHRGGRRTQPPHLPSRQRACSSVPAFAPAPRLHQRRWRLSHSFLTGRVTRSEVADFVSRRNGGHATDADVDEMFKWLAGSQASIRWVREDKRAAGVDSLARDDVIENVAAFIKASSKLPAAIVRAVPGGRTNVAPLTLDVISPTDPSALTVDDLVVYTNYVAPPIVRFDAAAAAAQLERFDANENGVLDGFEVFWLTRYGMTRMSYLWLGGGPALIMTEPKW